MKFISAALAVFTLAVSINTANAFTHTPSFARTTGVRTIAPALHVSSSPQNEGKELNLPDLPKLNTAIVNDVIDSVTKLDQIKPKNIKENVMDGTLGSRGELYFFGQAFLILCILIGGVPTIQPLLSILLGPGLLVSGLAVVLAGLGDMGGALSPFTKPPNTATARLVTEGTFQYMRHPMYTGLIALTTGLSIVSGSADRLLLTGLLFVFLDFKSSKEEEEMLVLYGDEYETYMKQVPSKFFPQNLITKED